MTDSSVSSCRMLKVHDIAALSTYKRALAYPEGDMGLSESSEFFELCVSEKYSFNRNFLEENVKNCTLISQFAQASKGLCPPNSPDPNAGFHFPRSPRLAPFGKVLDLPL